MNKTTKTLLRIAALVIVFLLVCIGSTVAEDAGWKEKTLLSDIGHWIYLMIIIGAMGVSVTTKVHGVWGNSSRRHKTF